jgi:hypothetical protein
MIRANCRKLRCTISVLRNTEVRDELTLDISETDINQEVEENPAPSISEQLHNALTALTLCHGREFPHNDAIYEIDRIEGEIVFAKVVEPLFRRGEQINEGFTVEEWKQAIMSDASSLFLASRLG